MSKRRRTDGALPIRFRPELTQVFREIELNFGERGDFLTAGEIAAKFPGWLDYEILTVVKEMRLQGIDVAKGLFGKAALRGDALKNHINAYKEARSGSTGTSSLREATTRYRLQKVGTSGTAVNLTASPQNQY